MGKEVKEEGVVLEPAANLPSLLRCIIQCFSHNSLRFEGLSSPSHAAGKRLAAEPVYSNPALASISNQGRKHRGQEHRTDASRGKLISRGVEGMQW
ncbi:hypothetical protein KUDE01_029230 [Dissostichus eleginoides]|uniref:Uncharacterized protein n=1 Tax=Dissostichus eleginoides TaxID=100907 RepID=A0AAD9BQA9_DISEL|nr:hypothetical protein KUDE01_029230 [Dissostichus eleginoides]